ncbi:unnamed protein product, partial [Boreogadus saida]
MAANVSRLSPSSRCRGTTASDLQEAEVPKRCPATIPFSSMSRFCLLQIDVDVEEPGTSENPTRPAGPEEPEADTTPTCRECSAWDTFRAAMPLHNMSHDDSKRKSLVDPGAEPMKAQEQEPSFWQEVGRWGGSEESPQAGGPPSSHISYLTFKSLVQLRRTLNTGVVMLDCKELSLATIAEKMVDELVKKKEIRPGDREGVLNSLIHNPSQSADPESQVLTKGTEIHNIAVKEKSDAAESVEASMVLVGSLDFLEKPTVAFVRLKAATVLDSALEAAVPVRFVFVLIGPGKNNFDYHETGRAMAALMADKEVSRSRLPCGLAVVKEVSRSRLPCGLAVVKEVSRSRLPCGLAVVKEVSRSRLPCGLAVVKEVSRSRLPCGLAVVKEVSRSRLPCGLAVVKEVSRSRLPCGLAVVKEVSRSRLPCGLAVVKEVSRSRLPCGLAVVKEVFNQAALRAQGAAQVTVAVSDFMDCSVVIPPTEIQSEAALSGLLGFQKRLLEDRQLPPEPSDPLTAAARRGSLSTGAPADDPLARTGRPFGGMLRDMRGRYKHYRSDLTDALNSQVLAAVIFIYFAALSPAITFGGLLADKVDNMMGVSELLVSTSLQGVLFCLLSAQPVLVIGFSGPLLVFEEAFFAFCQSQDIEYIVGRVWVGVWLVIIVVLIVALEGSFLVRFISRFTQEIFSILISLIFIYETFAKLGRTFRTHPLVLNYDHLNSTLEEPWQPMVTERRRYDNGTGNTTVTKVMVNPAYPNTALLSMCLMLGCFFIAFFLRQFKNGTFLPGKVRRLLGDFGVPIAIFLMVVADISIEDVYTQKLVVPKGLTVSNPAQRGWLINPFGEHKAFPVWVMFACCVPAILVFILIFLESQITTLIVSKPERKMVKGSGFHFDLLLLVSMGGLSAIFGMPWLSAATVRSVTHANALTVMSKGPKPQIQRVLEQRVSGVLVALLVGLSILMEPILKMIPMSALFGIFLYMGITSLNGIQLWDRILLLFIPQKYHPDEPYATQ